jgi:hypothetical protein
MCNQLCRFFLLVLFAALPSYGGEGFHIGQLPPGKSITLPTPTPAIVPVNSSVRLSATSSRQTLKISSIYSGNGPAPTVRLAIFDGEATKVQYIDIKVGSPVLYSFKSLKSIQMISKAGAKAGAHSVLLKVESDNPVGVTRS